MWQISIYWTSRQPEDNVEECMNRTLLEAKNGQGRGRAGMIIRRGLCRAYQMGKVHATWPLLSELDRTTCFKKQTVQPAQPETACILCVSLHGSTIKSLRRTFNIFCHPVHCKHFSLQDMAISLFSASTDASSIGCLGQFLGGGSLKSLCILILRLKMG